MMTEAGTCIWKEYERLCEDTLGTFMDSLILLIQQGKVKIFREQELYIVNKLALPPTFVEWARTVEM
jgi:hypothetical protein